MTASRQIASLVRKRTANTYAMHCQDGTAQTDITSVIDVLFIRQRRSDSMAINSRRKGAEFERRLAEILRGYGYSDSRRGQQYSGINGDADVVGLPHIHIEAKAVEKLNIYDAMEQSKRDARTLELPVVIHKKNRKNILVTMELNDFILLYKAFEKEGVFDKLEKECDAI